MQRIVGLALAAMLIGACAGGDSGSATSATAAETQPEGGGETTQASAELVELNIPVLAAPSLGYFLPPVIAQNGFDEANGLKVTFTQKPAGTFRTDFAGGSDMIGGSGTLLADVSLVNQEGQDTVYVFNLFDFWGAVVAPDGSPVQSFADLPGHSLGAALPTANYAMLRGVFVELGIDEDSIALQNADIPGLGPLAQSGRVDAVHLWEPLHTILLEDPDFDFTTLDIAQAWREETGVTNLAYLGVAAHRSWLDENPEVIQQVYEMYKDAAEWVTTNPEEAGEVVGAALDVEPSVITSLIQSDRLGLNIYPANEGRDDIQVLLERAVEIGYLNELPDLDAILYDGLDQ